MKAKWRQYMYTNTRRREVTHQSGDLVWSSSRNLPGLSSCSELVRHYRGTSPISECPGPVASWATVPPTYTCQDVFHVSHFVKDCPRDPQMVFKQVAVTWIPVQDRAGRAADQHEVDHIMAQRRTGTDT